MKTQMHPFKELLILLLIAFGLLSISSIFVAAIMLLAHNSIASIRIAQVVSQVCSFLLPVFVVALLYHKHDARAFYGLDFSAPKWGVGLVGVVCVILMMPVVDWLTVWNEAWQLPEALAEALHKTQEASEAILQQMMQGPSVATLGANLLVVALTAAVCEEVFFRAGVQRLLTAWIPNPHVAIWLSAALFSLLHGEVYAFMPRLLLGALLGYLYYYTRSILPGIITHFVNNATVVVAYWMMSNGWVDFDPSEPLQANVWITVGCSIVVLLVFWYAVIRKHPKKPELNA